jgi:hypothetical protein
MCPLVAPLYQLTAILHTHVPTTRTHFSRCTSAPYPCTAAGFKKTLAKRQQKMLYIFFWGVYVFTFFYVFFVGAVQGCDVGGAETQCRIYSGKWYDGASAWGGTG